MKTFDLKQVKIGEGFWAERQKINAEVTMKSVAQRFKERFDALKCKPSEQKSHVFWDSDVAKWLEAAAYVLAEREDEEIRARYEEAVRDICENQREDGYFNSYFEVYEPEAVFTRRTDHELYCAGHIFEAAVAAAQYLNDDRLLNFSEKYVDYIRLRFMERRDTGFVTPGHEEIELALLRLYDLTKDEKYKETAKFFIDERGRNEEAEYFAGECGYSQSAKEVRKQTEAEGHAVRALYLYTAMAHMAKTDNDKALKAAAESLYDDIVNKKMYITGATGSSHSGERFSNGYVLPNYKAYAETCASIALVLFCDRMYRLTGEKKYADTLERATYNGALAGVSLDGDAFFYVNPLEMRLDENKYNGQMNGAWHEHAPLAKRVKLFDCSCCPPNVARFIAEIGSYVYYEDEEENGVTVAQYVSSKLSCERAEIEMRSSMPYEGKVALKVDSFGKKLKLKLRKPEWSRAVFENEKDGYLVYEGVFCGEEIEVDFQAELRAVYGNARIFDTAGKVAFSYGPLVLCAEGTDNAFNLAGTSVCRGAEKNGKVRIKRDSLYVLCAEMEAETRKETAALYSYESGESETHTLRLIPYFAWANREENDMQVWITER